MPATITGKPISTTAQPSRGTSPSTKSITMKITAMAIHTPGLCMK